MFVKLTKANGAEYIQIVSSYRDHGQVKHKVLFNLGRKDELAANPGIHRVIQRLAQITETPLERSENNAAIGLCEGDEGAEVRNWGYLVYLKLWQQLGLPTLLEGMQGRHNRMQIPLNQAAFIMAVQRVLAPCSKRGTFAHQEEYLYLPQVGLHRMYRALDVLAKSKEEIEQHLFERNRSLFNMQIDVVFYDVTTFYFESVEDDELKNFGFSKDNKVNQVQVVMGLLIDQEGRPIGYELFSGNTFDAKTLQTMLDSLERRFGIKRVILVADRGFNSKANLKALKDRGYGYIVASRLRSMGEAVKTQVFSPEGYETPRADEDASFRYKVLDYQNRVKAGDGQWHQLPEKIIVTYSGRRAKKDRHDRMQLVEKANRLMGSPSSIRASNRGGGKKYLRTDSAKECWHLDEQAIQDDERWDGYYGIQTSELELSVQEILDAYHALWRIEECFRVMKTTMETRPIFHWTPERIRGHFVTCFLAFQIERALELRLRKNGSSLSPNEIRSAILSMRCAECKLGDETAWLKLKQTKAAGAILRYMHIPQMKNIALNEDIQSMGLPVL